MIIYPRRLQGVHPSEVILGYTIAAAKLQELLPELVVHKLEDPRDKVALTEALRAVVASKHLGHEDMLSALVSQAVSEIMPPAPKRPYVNVDNVRVAKLIGGGVADSTVIKGIVVMRTAEGAVSKAENAKVAVFGCAMESAATETKGTIVIKSPEQLKEFNKREERMMEEAVKGLADAGAKVVVVGGSISEIAQHFLDKYNMLVVKIISKFELRRLCASVGATAMVRVGPPTADELGYADVVEVRDISSRRVVVFQQHDEESRIATIILRGSTMNLLDDMERAITDAVNGAKVLCRDGRLVAGAGACEMELAHRIHALGESTPGLEQYAIKKFAEALESVPRVLAENSGQEATDLVAALYTAHGSGAATAGVDISVRVSVCLCVSLCIHVEAGFGRKCVLTTGCVRVYFVFFFFCFCFLACVSGRRCMRRCRPQDLRHLLHEAVCVPSGV